MNIRNQQQGRRRGRGGPRPPGQGGGMIRADAPRLDNRSRGNAAQQLERYKSLAREATQSGDRITAEYYLQYADHYFRVLNENRPRYEDQRPQQGRDWQGQGGYQDGEADYVRDEEGGQADGQSYAERANGERDPRGDDQSYERDNRSIARQRDERSQARVDRSREDRPQDRQRDERSREYGQRDARQQTERSRDENQQADRSRDERPREDRAVDDRQASREQRPRRERWVQQGGAEPTDPPVPSREPSAARAQPEDRAEPDEGETRPRRGRPRRLEGASDDPFAVRRAPQPAASEPTVSETVADGPGPLEPPAIPVRRRRARKAAPDNDAELSLENA